MMTTMRPIMRPCSGTSLPAADDPTGVPVSTSPQVGGFIILRCGAHDDGTGLIGVREPQMNRNTALRLLDSRSSCSRTPAQHTDGRTTGPTSPELNNTGFQLRLDSHVLPSLDSNEEEQRRIRRPQSPGDTRHPDHTQS